MDNRYCKHCQVEHDLTPEFWYRLESYPRCKRQVKVKTRRNYNSEKAIISNRKYRDTNREYLNNQTTKWRENNLERHRANSRAYYYENKTEVLKKTAVRHKARLQVDVNYKIAAYLRTRTYNALHSGWKAGSAIKDLGCTVEELRVHLESIFQPGMSWDNHAVHGWHIDHILPLASFDLSDPEQFKIAVNYKNLQPLWAEDNLIKSSKVV